MLYRLFSSLPTLVSEAIAHELNKQREVVGGLHTCCEDQLQSDRLAGQQLQAVAASLQYFTGLLSSGHPASAAQMLM